MNQFDPEFVQAMKRVEELRKQPAAGGGSGTGALEGTGSFSSAPKVEAPPAKLLRRHPLMQHQMPNANFAIYHLLGWAYMKGQ